MSEHDRLNDLNLEILERQLRTLGPMLCGARRDELVFACGAACARRENRRQMLCLTMAASSLALVAGCLLAIVFAGRSDSAPAGPASLVTKGPDDFEGPAPERWRSPRRENSFEVERADPRTAEAGRLRAGVSLEEALAILDRGPRLPATGRPAAALQNSQPLLPGSPFIE